MTTTTTHSCNELLKLRCPQVFGLQPKQSRHRHRCSPLATGERDQDPNSIEYQVKALTVENKRLQMSFETNVSAYRNLNGLYESEHNRLQDTINDLRDKYLKLESENQKLRVELDTAEKEKKEAEEAKKVAEETIEHNRRWGLELAERNRVWLLECETFWKTKLSEAEQRAKNTEEHFKRKLKELNSVIWQTRNENDDLRREIRRWAPAAWFAGNARSTVAAASGLASWW